MFLEFIVDLDFTVVFCALYYIYPKKTAVKPKMGKYLKFFGQS